MSYDQQQSEGEHGDWGDIRWVASPSSPPDGLLGGDGPGNDLDFYSRSLAIPVSNLSPAPPAPPVPSSEAGGYGGYNPAAAAASVWPNNVPLYSSADGAAGGYGAPLNNGGNLGAAGACKAVPTQKAMVALPWNGCIPTAAGAVIIPSPSNTAGNGSGNVQSQRMVVANALKRVTDAQARAQAQAQTEVPGLDVETERRLKQEGVGGRDQYRRISAPVAPDGTKPVTKRGRVPQLDANGQAKRSHHGKKAVVVITEKDDDDKDQVIAQLHAEVRRLKDENDVLRAGMGHISETFTWTRTMLDRVAQPRGGEGGAAS